MMDIDEGLEEHICNRCNMGLICFAIADGHHSGMAIVAVFVRRALKDRTSASSLPLGPM